MKDLTQGPVSKLLLGMSAFMLVGMFVQTAYSLIDLYWVGSLGPKAVAAVTVSSNLMFVSLAVGQMLGVGTGALIAQAVGAKDHAAAQRVFGQSLAMSGLAMLLFVLPALAGEQAFAAALSADPETARLAAAYLRWFVPGLALGYPIMVMSAALRGTGSMMPATLAQVGSVLLNIVLAPMLIFGWLGLPALGVAGAGLATLVSVLAALAGLVVHFARSGNYLKLRPREWRPEALLWARLLKIGLPSAVEFALMTCYMLFITSMLRPYGAAEQAAFGIGQRLLQAAMLPVMAMSFAASALAGQNYGAKLGGRVRETFSTTLKFGFVAMIPLCLLAQLAPTALISGFSHDPDVLVAGTRFLRVLSLNLLATSVAFSCFGVLSGLGNTVPTLISSATRITLIVASALLLERSGRFEVVWLWWLSVSATVVQMTMNLVFLRRELRLKLGAADMAGPLGQEA